MVLKNHWCLTVNCQAWQGAEIRAGEGWGLTPGAQACAASKLQQDFLLEENRVVVTEMGKAELIAVVLF